jgi:hypothetical protein
MRSNVGTIIIVVVIGALLFSARVTKSQAVLVPIAATISLEKTVITQGEPVILNITFVNATPHGVVVNLGSEDEKLDITVVDPAGRVLRRPAPRPRQGWAAVDAFNVGEGATSVGSVSLNEWFIFDRVGPYQVEVNLSPLSFPKEPFAYNISGNRATLTLSVVPRDETSLASACADLLKRAKDLHSYSAALTAARALSSINDPVAVPYLAAAAKRKEFASMMIAALARLKTTKAVEALVLVSQSGDPETATSARAALTSLGMTVKK